MPFPDMFDAFGGHQKPKDSAPGVGHVLWLILQWCFVVAIASLSMLLLAILLSSVYELMNSKNKPNRWIMKRPAAKDVRVTYAVLHAPLFVILTPLGAIGAINGFAGPWMALTFALAGIWTFAITCIALFCLTRLVLGLLTVESSTADTNEINVELREPPRYESVVEEEDGEAEIGSSAMQEGDIDSKRRLLSHTQ